MMIKTFPFLITHVGPIYFSLFLFPFIFPSAMCLFILCYAGLFPVVYLIQFSKQNRHNCILFLENFCVSVYIFLLCYHHFFYSIQAYVIVYFPPFFFRLLFEVE